MNYIWSNENLDIDDWREDLLDQFREEGEDNPSEEDLYQRMVETNATYFDDEKANLDIDLGAPIVAVATLGLWNGNFRALSVVRSGNVSDCLNLMYEFGAFYVDGDGEFRSSQTHHDGTNTYWFRKSKGTNMDWLDKAREAIMFGGDLDRIIEKYTGPIGPTIAGVYGWDLQLQKKPLFNSKTNLQVAYC